MASFKPLPWDSSFFNLSVESLACSTANESELLQLLSESKGDLTYVFNDLQLNSHRQFSYSGTKVLFNKTLGFSNFPFDSAFGERNRFHISNLNTELFSLHEKEIKKLAYLSGDFSRFKIDPQFGDDSFYLLYDEWIKGAINHSNDNFISCCFDTTQNKAIALLTAFVDDSQKKTNVGLFSVDNNYQRLGIGKAMIAHLENHCINKKIQSIQIPTQLENKKACTFYHAQNYQISEIKYIYHHWK